MAELITMIDQMLTNRQLIDNEIIKSFQLHNTAYMFISQMPTWYIMSNKLRLPWRA